MATGTNRKRQHDEWDVSEIAKSSAASVHGVGLRLICRHNLRNNRYQNYSGIIGP